MPNPSLKADAAEILEFFQELPAELRLDRHRAEWTRHVYHYTDVTNVPGILMSGRLLSRARCEAEKVDFHDAADREVIAQSKAAHQYVRLYFRPCTPTQYHMEGIKPLSERRNKAHCPVPVFFVFDARCLLPIKGVEFSNGNIARGYYEIGDSIEFLQSVPFESVYHTGVIPAEQRSQVTFHRCAEVLARDSLGLECLQEIVCRSGPERQTLLSLLGSDRGRWESQIRLEKPNEGLFNKRGAYVTDVTLKDRDLTIRTSAWLGDFTFDLQVVRMPGGEAVRRERQCDVASRVGSIDGSRARPRQGASGDDWGRHSPT